MRDRILNVLARGFEDPPDEEEFDRLARGVFAHQFRGIASYRNWCNRLGRTPDRVSHWEEIPPLTTAAFKETVLSTAPSAEAAVSFLTSGTSMGRSGRHDLATTLYYEAAILPPFVRAVDSPPLPMAILVPTRSEAPRSSLSFMADHLARRWAPSGGFDFFVSQGGLDVEGLLDRLRRSEVSGSPLFLFGTAFALLPLLEVIEAKGMPVRLPAGSRVLDTGGTKGRTRSVTRAELLARYEEWLGVDPRSVIIEYGMTELSSQLYARGDEGRFRGPPWIRIRVLHPATLEACGPGEEGLVALFDLANVDSVASIVTSDLGRLHEDGSMELSGRARGAPMRGCSLDAEELGVQ